MSIRDSVSKLSTDGIIRYTLSNMTGLTTNAIHIRSDIAIPIGFLIEKGITK